MTGVLTNVVVGFLVLTLFTVAIRIIALCGGYIVWKSDGSPYGKGVGDYTLEGFLFLVFVAAMLIVSYLIGEAMLEKLLFIER